MRKSIRIESLGLKIRDVSEAVRTLKTANNSKSDFDPIITSQLILLDGMLDTWWAEAAILVRDGGSTHAKRAHSEQA